MYSATSNDTGSQGIDKSPRFPTAGGGLIEMEPLTLTTPCKSAHNDSATSSQLRGNSTSFVSSAANSHGGRRQSKGRAASSIGGGASISTTTKKKAESNPKKAKNSEGGSRKEKASVEPTCCAIPLGAVFGIGCIGIAVVFALITTISSLSFTQEVESSVKENLGTAMQGAMKYITEPLLQSQQYAEQLKTMIESSPDRYACDDSVASFPGNSSTSNFLYEAGMYALHRAGVAHIYQSRLSTRFLRTDGGGPAGVCCIIAPDQKLVYFMNNNSMHTATFTNGSYFDTLATQTPNPPVPLDITPLAVIRGPTETNTSRWVSDSISTIAAGLSEPANKYSYLVRINDPSDPTSIWSVGIDHNMVNLKTLLLQATPPISVGDSLQEPTQTSGAHTTIYDLNEGLVMASTHPDVPVAKAYGILFPAGQAPASVVNEAYREAISLCGDSGCTDATVTLGKSSVHTAYRINIPSAKLHLMMVSSVPRKFFFEDADRTFAVTLGLSIACCVITIVGCVFLLFLIRWPLATLKDNMMLAAELHNDRVVHTRTYLREVAALSAVFDGMNQQLLIARSFVPEAVLLGKTDDTQDFDDEGSIDGSMTEEKSTLHSRQRSSTKRSGSNHIIIEGDTSMEGTHNTSNNSSNGMAKLFNVAEKRVAVLSLNLVGFHALCAPERHFSRAHKIHEISTSLLTLAVACSHRERGVMDSFHGDHFILTFNASRMVSGPLAAAVRTANNFISEIHDGADFPFPGEAVAVAAGAAAGKAHVGTFGIDGYRRMSVVGEAYKSANALQQAAVQFLKMNAGLGLREGCLVEESAMKELGNCALHLQLVGCLQNSYHRVMQIGSDKCPPLTYFALDANVDSEATAAMKADGEWLYELDAIEATDPFQQTNSAMKALIEGDLDLCGKIVESYENDAAKRRLSIADAEHSNSDKKHQNRLNASATTRNAVAAAVVRAFDDSESSSSCTEITMMEGHHDATSTMPPAWNFVKHSYAQTQNVASALSETNAATSIVRQCPMPYLLFQQ